MQEQSNTKLVIGIVAVTVLIFGGLTWAILKAPSDTGTGQVVDVKFSSDENQPFQGPKDAKTVVHIYGDLQCPACKSAETGLRPTIEKYRDRVKFVWKDFPLPMHPNAKPAALAARCAYDQGWFWKMHDMMYDRQDEWVDLPDPQPKFEAYANELAALGMDVGKYKACVASGADMDKVNAGENEGLQNQVDRTPTFFINNRRYFTMTEQEWATALDAALAETGAASASSTH